MSFTPDQIELLKAPLNRSNVKERKMAGRTMSYVEGWHVIAEANRIFGFDGWASETVMLSETNRNLVDIDSDRGSYKQWRIGYIAKVRITAGGVSREGTGYGSGMGKPEAVGDAVEGAIKEAETDARKRALMTFGSTFGLALYDKEQAEVVDDTKPKPQGDKHPSAPAYAPVGIGQGDPTSANVLARPPQQSAMTPQAWAEMGISRVNGFKALQELDTFEKKFEAKIVQIAPLVPDLHAKLVAAMADKRFILEAQG